MAVLVTGGAGYIGSHTAVALQRAGYDVVVVDSLVKSSRVALERVAELSGRPVQFHQVDVRDTAALRGVFSGSDIEVVIHFAGLKAVGESVRFPLRHYDNNIAATVSLCAVMDEIGVRKLVFSSSATVYGNPGAGRFVETMPLAPVNPYGHTKAMIEQILRDVADTGRGWQIALLRCFNPVGADPSGRIGEDPAGVPGNLVPSSRNRQGDLRSQRPEQVPRPRPVRVERRGELVDRRGAGTDLVIAQPHQRSQLTQARFGRFETTQAVPVGAQIDSQLITVTRVGLRTRCPPARAGRIKRRGMHRDHRMSRLKQPVDDQAAGPLDDHRQVVRVAVAAQATQRGRPAGFGVGERPPVHHTAGVVEHGDIVRLACPVPADVLHPGFLEASMVHSTVSRPCAGSSLFGPRSGMSLTPVRGLGAPGGGSTKTGRRSGAAARPSPDTTEEPRPGTSPDRTAIVPQ